MAKNGLDKWFKQKWVDIGSKKKDGSFRIGIANLNFRNKKADQISENLIKSDCEIVVLLEWTGDNANTNVLQSDGFRIVLDARQSNTNGIGVIAKKDLNVSADLLESPVDGPCRMPMVVVRFDYKDDRFTLIGVHVPPPFPMCRQTRVPTIGAVSSWVEDGVLVEDKGVGRKGDRVIIAGDFNDWRGQAEKYLETELALKEGFKTLYGSHAKTFPALKPTLPVDRIYYRNLDLQTCMSLGELPWRNLSDHIPLFAEFMV